jgi:hypothetical protein
MVSVLRWTGEVAALGVLMSRLDVLLSILEFPRDAVTVSEINERVGVELCEAREAIDLVGEAAFDDCFGCEDGCIVCERRPRVGKWASGSMPAVRR